MSNNKLEVLYKELDHLYEDLDFAYLDFNQDFESETCQKIKITEERIKLCLLEQREG